MGEKGQPGPVPMDRGFPLRTAVALGVAVCACAVYANLSFAVKDRDNYRYFPPFLPGVNRNWNNHLGGEYFNIAKALAAGKGFANPFDRQTGPTAWQPPLLPALLAGLLWACDGNKDAVMAVVIFLQVATLIGTGLLVLVLARQTARRVGPPVVAALFFLALLCDFKLCLQLTHDNWLVLLALDLLLAGLCWLRPLGCWRTAAGWGLFGGCCALVSQTAAILAVTLLGLSQGALAGELKELTMLKATWPVLSVSFSPDGKMLASGGGTTALGEVTLWDVAAARKRHTLPVKTSQVSSVAFSPDGKTLASGSRVTFSSEEEPLPTVKLWDMTTGKQRTSFHQLDTACSLAFSPDGKSLAVGCGDGMVRLWDVGTGKERAILKGHSARVWSVVFSPDGASLASGSQDKMVKLWDVMTGKQQATLMGRGAGPWGRGPPPGVGWMPAPPGGGEGGGLGEWRRNGGVGGPGA